MATGTKTHYFAYQWLNHFFNNAGIARLGDLAGMQASAVEGSLYLSLHHADPRTAASDQSVNETDYGGYLRMAVPRDSNHWTVTMGSGATLTKCENAYDIVWPTATSAATVNKLSWVGIGYDKTGGDDVLHWAGQLDTDIFITGAGCIAKIPAGALVINASI